MDSGPSAPRVLGRYALHDVIASGGMARIHLGRLIGPVGFSRTVAIKRLHPQFAADPEFVSMFLDEAHLAARIRHPNVVATIDVVATEGELFLVMEYVQGESLAQLMRTSFGGSAQAPVPVPFAASIMAGVLRGLHAAHEATNERGEPLDIVHRDVSPHNILVGVDGVARVLDFGVAKAAGRLQATREGQLKGKMAYMAPEHLQAERVDRRGDVYAASVVLWEMLSGRRLFKGDSDIEVFGKILRDRIDPPSRYAPGIPPELDAVTMRGLARSADDRYPTARDMARALERVVPPVAVAEVGEWVEALAADILATRARQVALIEGSWDSAPGRPSDVLRQGAAGGDDLDITELSAKDVHSEDTRSGTQLSSASVPELPATSQPTRPGYMFGAAVGAFAALGVLAFVFSMRAARSSHAHEGTPGAESASPPSSTAAAPPAVGADPFTPPQPAADSQAGVPEALASAATPPVVAAPTQPEPVSAGTAAADASTPGRAAEKPRERPADRPATGAERVGRPPARPAAPRRPASTPAPDGIDGILNSRE